MAAQQPRARQVAKNEASKVCGSAGFLSIPAAMNVTSNVASTIFMSTHLSMAWSIEYAIGLGRRFSVTSTRESTLSSGAMQAYGMERNSNSLNNKRCVPLSLHAPYDLFFSAIAPPCTPSVSDILGNANSVTTRRSGLANLTGLRSRLLTKPCSWSSSQ